MRATSANRLVHSRLDARARSAERFQDLQLEFRAGGKPVARVGGRWDRARKEFAGDAERSRVVELHAFQVRAMELFDRWLERHVAGRDVEANARARELVLAGAELDAEAAALIALNEIWLVGGRRAGKSVALMAILASYAIAVPNARVGCVVPTEAYRDEPKSILEELLPRSFASWRGDPLFRFDFVSGSTLMFLSAVKPTALKRAGRLDVVGFNELQAISRASFNTASGALIDRGGICVVASNPPSIGDEQWVLDACVAIGKGERPGAELLLADALENPHVDHRKLLALRSSLTDHEWETQMRGQLRELPGAVLHTYQRAVQERPPPELARPITGAFLEAHEGPRDPGREWRHLIAIDLQSAPYIACCIVEVFRDPNAPNDPRAGIFWVVDEAFVEGDEVDVCDELKRRGIDGARCLTIVDASAFWQQIQRDVDKQRPEYRGQGSADMLRRCGFPPVRPDKHMKSNPHISDRVKALASAIRTADGVSHFYVDPTKAPLTAESLRTWRRDKRGKPSRSAQAAHAADACGYLAWRLGWARRGVVLAGERLTSETMPRDRGDSVERGWPKEIG